MLLSPFVIYFVDTYFPHLVCTIIVNFKSRAEWHSNQDAVGPVLLVDISKGPCILEIEVAGQHNTSG